MGVHSRRSLLAATGCLAAGTVAARLLSVARAAEEAEESAVCFTMVFANAPKAKFDTRYYRDKHLPMLKTLYGDSLERVELRTPRKALNRGLSGNPSGQSNLPGTAPASMGPPSAVLATASLWVRDVKAFNAKTEAASQDIVADLARLTEVKPNVQYDKVLVLLGESRAAIEPEAQVFSTYFPATEGGRFDIKYYGETVIPLMVSQYGKDSIRRIEYTAGSVGLGGGKVSVLAASHFYIRNRQAWDAAAMKAYPQLMAEGPKYTTLTPIVADGEVAVVG